ncbi:hypothetical protein [Marinilabilia salmonicolor]|jgi:hypothetical protein|uniref:Uncharacterized protein n=1 Tax=Marinilabilia salmonicolor TaxID=989 RepID=A0A368UXK9_9BACT|nr:hypothetical protein [Marinilabilia salmonicolor]RCW31621.1 hypothetical protein DFO77_11767 [Marinilabilia salmonicolor]
MWILLLSISAALIVALIINKLTSTKEEPKEAPPSDCCGAHEVCDKESLIAHTHGEIIYFNDEELDRFKGQAPDQYTPDETEQFREVLLTMHPHEVNTWLRSMMARGIRLPLDVREEALAILKRQRA